MASKHKRGPGKSPSADVSPPRLEVDRLIAKGRYKDAVREAKICHRDHPSPEHHRLLERAYLLRAQQLRGGGMPTAAAEVAQHLLDFGITDPGLTEPAAALLLAVGMAARSLELQGKLDDPAARERLARHAADQAVLRPGRASPAGVVEGAGRVREALEAVAAGDEARAQDAIRDVGRNSPFADWRLFARGLAAFRRGDDADARAAWDRLDPDRAASRIARALLAASAFTPVNAPAPPKREGLERWAFGEPLLGPLRDLREAVGRGEWAEAVRKLAVARVALRRVDPRLAVRLTEALYSPIIREASDLGYREGRDLIRAFTRAAEPIPADPRWNRLWALVWQGPQGDIDEAEPYWRRYLDDLKDLPAIRPEERDRARALVLTRLGERLAEEAEGFDLPGPGPRRVVEGALEDRRRAVACLEESLGLFPGHRATYQALMDLHDRAGQPDRADEAARRLLEAIPDDFDALVYLANRHFRRDEPSRSLEYLLRARKLRPLDSDVLRSEWASRVSMARQLALQGRYDEGRAELDTAARLAPDLARSAHFAARRAAFEIKAGRPDLAGPILDGARSLPGGPAPFRLAMAIEARRFQLPKAEVDRYQAEWAATLSEKVKGETAGALADLMASFMEGKIEYRGRDEHARQVVDYLRRTTRIKYNRDDLARACAFLGLMDGEHDLLAKLAGRGLKLFPDAPEFPMILGGLEISKGPYRADLRKARRHLESALKLAQARETTDPRSAEIIPRIKQALTTVTDLGGVPMGLPFDFPFPQGGRGAPPASMIDELEAMFEESGLDPDDLDDLFFGPDPDDEGPSPAPSRRPGPKKKGKRR